MTEWLVERLQTCDLDLIVVNLPLHQQDIVCSSLMRDPLVLVTPQNREPAVRLPEM